METHATGHPELAAPRDASGASAAMPTIEVAGYVLLVGLALVIRLFRPAWMPLDPAEASIALAATGRDVVAAGGGAAASPLLVQLERLVMWCLGAGDPAARLVPALAGVAAVALAYRLRPLVGRAGALAAAAFLSLSPLWVYLGRNVSPATLAAAAALALLGGVANRYPRDALLVPAAAGLALAAGGPAWTLGLAVLGYGVWRYAGPGRARLADDIDQLWPTPSSRRSALLALAIALVLGATGLATQPAGLSGVLAGLGAYASRVALAGADRGAFLLSLCVYAPAVLVCGVVGIGMAAGSERALLRLLAVWATLGLVAGWLGGAPDGVADALVPLTLVAAVAVGRLVEATADSFRWLEDGAMAAILLVVIGYSIIQFWAFSKAADADLGSQNWILALGALAMGALLVALFALLWGAPVAFRSAAWAGLLAMAVFAWSNGSGLAFRPSVTPLEPMRPVYTAPGAHELAAALADASWSRALDPDAWSALVDPSLEATLAWELRDRDLTWAQPGDQVKAKLVVVPSGQPVSLGPAPYRGQSYTIGGRWHPAFDSRHALARWLFHRRAAAPGASDVSIRADLYVDVDVEEGEG